MERQKVLQQLAEAIVSIRYAHPLRVAIDGVDAAGKTTLADELVPVIERYSRPIVRASIDGFHRPRQERYQQGPGSPKGYYEDSFNYAALREVLLLPLGPNGSRHYRHAVFDVHTDTPIAFEDEVAAPNAVLLFDGVFLLRPELETLWDYRIFVSVDSDVALLRAMSRDLGLFGSSEAVEARYLQRYLPGQQLYLQAVQPHLCADAIVENNDVAHPGLIFPKEQTR